MSDGTSCVKRTRKWPKRTWWWFRCQHPQTAVLLKAVGDLGERAASVPVAGCWTLMARFRSTLPVDYDGAFAAAPEIAMVHRGRYALPIQPLAQPCLYDAHRMIGACGDWYGGSDDSTVGNLR